MKLTYNKFIVKIFQFQFCDLNLILEMNFSGNTFFKEASFIFRYCTKGGFS